LLNVEHLQELYAKGKLDEIVAIKNELRGVYEDINKEKMLLNATLDDIDTPDEIAELDKDEPDDEVDI
jgi:uncharacterized protein YkvS